MSTEVRVLKCIDLKQFEQQLKQGFDDSFELETASAFDSHGQTGYFAVLIKHERESPFIIKKRRPPAE